MKPPSGWTRAVRERDTAISIAKSYERMMAVIASLSPDHELPIVIRAEATYAQARLARLVGARRRERD